jgi:hypothetical protein
MSDQVARDYCRPTEGSILFTTFGHSLSVA